MQQNCHGDFLFLQKEETLPCRGSISCWTLLCTEAVLRQIQACDEKEERQIITFTLAVFQASCSLLVYSLLCVSGEFALPTDHHLSTTECFSCVLCSELRCRSSTRKSSRPSLKPLLILGERGDAKNRQCQETGRKIFMLNQAILTHETQQRCVSPLESERVSVLLSSAQLWFL